MKHCAYAVALALFLAAGCQQQHLLADYRPLVKAGVFSGTIEQLKTLNVTEAEIAQFLKLKNANISDDVCIALITAAHAHQHPFNSADSVLNLQGARYADSDILVFAHANQLDTIAPEAVMLHLIGLSNATVQAILDRHMKGLPTMGSAEIGRLKNTGLTEKQILERIESGMTDQAANKEAAAREAARNHSHTDFVRVRGRRPR
jgi:hypothetical protein